MKVKKSDLMDAMKKCLPGVETGTSIIEGADTFVFSDGVVHSYNDSISVSAPLSVPGIVGCVKSAEFYKLISKLSDDDIDINFTEETWEVSSGKISAEIAIIQNKITEYVKTLNISAIEWKPLPSKFMEALKLCKIPHNRSTHRGIYVNEDVLLSTDLQRINNFKLDAAMGTFWIDDPAVNELLKFPALLSFSISDSWVYFRSVDGAVFSCKRKEDSVYPYQRIVKICDDHIKDDTCVEGTLPPLLDAVVDRVSILSRDISGWQAVKLTFTQSELLVSSQRSAGKIKESIPFTKQLSKDINLSIWIDSEFIADASRKVPDFYIKTMKIGENLRTDFIFHNDYFHQIISTITE